MTDTVTNEYEEELQLLKQRANLMGIKYSNNIGKDALKAKIDAKLEESSLANEAQDSKIALRKKIQEEQLKLVRIRLMCMNPAKAAWRGEFVTIANSLLGTVKKFIPYDAKFYTNGYHVPYCIYNHLKNKTYLHIATKDKGGKTEVQTQFVPEFSIEVLPQLTEEELQELAAAQVAGNRIDS